MSGFHNNANWIAPNIIQYRRFNSGHNHMYFTPTGKLLECYSWYSKTETTEATPEERVEGEIEALKVVDQMQVMPFDKTLTGKACSNPSPSIRLYGYDYNLQQCMAMYFMEHGDDTSELDDKVKSKHPATEEDKVNAIQFIESDIVNGKVFNYELCQEIPKKSETH